MAKSATTSVALPLFLIQKFDFYEDITTIT